MNYPDRCTLLHWDETNSTNNLLSKLCDEQHIAAFTTVYTDYQTAGKGQRGNTWEAERGANALFSFVCYPTFLEARRQFLLSQIASLAVCQQLAQYAEGFSIKWPNDIYWQDKKIAGILIENDLAGMHIGRCITGIGLNINQKTFSKELPNPVSLTQITHQSYDCRKMIGDILHRAQVLYQLGQEEQGAADIAQQYKERLFRKQGMHRYADAGGEWKGRIVEVEPDGHLVLEDEQGKLRRYAFKEVEYLL